MDNKGQNKQKKFWTVFAIVVAIFAILLATGVIERGPQPQAAEHAEDDKKDACNNECGGDTTCQEQGGSCKSVLLEHISARAIIASGVDTSWMRMPEDPCKEHENKETEEEKISACKIDSGPKCQWFPNPSTCVCQNCGNYCNEEAGTVCNKDTGQCDCASNDDDDDDEGKNACTRAYGNCVNVPPGCGEGEEKTEDSCFPEGLISFDTICCKSKKTKSCSDVDGSCLSDKESCRKLKGEAVPNACEEEKDICCILPPAADDDDDKKNECQEADGTCKDTCSRLEKNIEKDCGPMTKTTCCRAPSW